MNKGYCEWIKKRLDSIKDRQEWLEEHNKNDKI